jgi:integrase
MMTAAGRQNSVASETPKRESQRHTWDADRKARIFEMVKATTEKARGLEMLDRLKGERTDQTRAIYKRLASPRVNLFAEDRGGLMDKVTRSSFDTTKAAVLYELARLYQGHRRMADDEHTDMKRWEDHHKLARRAALAYEQVVAMKKPEGRSPKMASKGRSLPPASWQRVVFNAADTHQKPALAVMWATGCRPAEVELGVDLERTNDGIIIRIPGAKVSETKGQPMRSVLIDPGSEAGKALLDVMGAETSMTVQRTAKQVANDFTKHLKKRAGMPQVSAYSFRHQTASDLKAGSADPMKVAEALGHASVHTQRHYGSSRRGSAVSPIIAAQAEREVRSPAVLPQGRTPMPGRNWDA